ncbi:DUF2793 domain-containing protein [Parvularcula sp. LCG005]|uniref:DUF2793 domain-containing protein n=1 Tax=Parvularcula sp. LCG005 TaxID=3078805 RepID=UPI0029427C51|nr:DUF2793 domain-containing protein [Parvularcula sp. LCG005]WOI53802.1 DUF2793 domain-containing protein [Parvularcula sp. LCG005]
MERSDRLSLPYVQAAQAQKHVTVNEATRALDALVHLSVISRSVTEQPAEPGQGDGYILSPDREGLQWGVMGAASVAVFQDNAWMEYAPVQGMTAYVADEARHVVWNGTEWTALASGLGDSAPQFGVNATADTTNRLAVKTNAVLFSHDDVTPGSGDVRQVLNKASASNTASQLFQTNYSARAEFGLTGTDDFLIKVSPDGTSFFDAIVINRLTGAVSFPNTPAFDGGEPPFTPAAIDGLSVWYDPSDGGSIDSTASRIAQLNDKSGNDLHAVQTTGSAQPLIEAAAIDGHGAMRFTGSEYLSFNAFADAISGNDLPWSISLVVQHETGSGGISIPFGLGRSSNAGISAWFGSNGNGRWRIAKTSAAGIPLDATPLDTKPHVVTINHSGTATSLWIDGFRVLNDIAQDVNGFTVDRATLGAWITTSVGYHFRGLIGEVVGFTRQLNDNEVRDLQRYLAEKWLSAPTKVDLFLAIGQSNMEGQGDKTLSPSVNAGSGFALTQQNMLATLADPVGNANTGSCLPAFGNRWYAETGRAAVVVSKAVGATALLPEADIGYGNWDKVEGALYGAAVTAMNLAMDTVLNGSIYTVHSVNALWCQGEAEANRMSIGTAGVTPAAMKPRWKPSRQICRRTSHCQRRRSSSSNWGHALMAATRHSMRRFAMRRTLLPMTWRVSM